MGRRKLVPSGWRGLFVVRRLRREGGYAGSFLDQYLAPILYPGGLTRGTQIGLGVFVLVVNIAIYTAVTQRRWK